MKRRLTGTVVSDKPDQTVVVAIERSVNHPVYRKPHNVTKKLHVHDPGNKQKIGDVVTVEEIPPKSALKRWQVVESGVEGVKKVTEKTRAAKSQKQLENEAKEAEQAAAAPEASKPEPTPDEPKENA